MADVEILTRRWSSVVGRAHVQVTICGSDTDTVCPHVSTPNTLPGAVNE